MQAALPSSKNINQQNSISFWKSIYSDIEPLDISFLNCKLFSNKNNNHPLHLPIEDSNNIEKLRFKFDEEILEKLKILNNILKIKPCLYAQSIFSFLLKRYSGQNNFCLGYVTKTKIGKNFINVDCILPYHFNKAHTILEVINQSSDLLKLLIEQYKRIPQFSIYNILTTLDFIPPSITFIHIYLKENVFISDKDILYPNIFNNEFSSHDLVFEQEIGEEINYRVLYNPNKINPDLLSDFIYSYKKLFIDILNELIAYNGSKCLQNLKNYNLLPKDKYEKILYSWNETNKLYRDKKTISELFEEEAKRVPQNIALIYEGKQHTYQELNERANKLANYLKQNYNIKPDTLISLCLDRNEYMFIAILAVLKAGGAYVPINPSTPDERISYILENADTTLILTNELHAEKINKIIKKQPNVISSQTGVKFNIIEIDASEFQKLSSLQSNKDPITSETKENNLAYVIYTSGTTGKPKGVMIEHKSFIATIDCLRSHYFEKNKEISTYNITHYAFDMIGPEYGLPLLTGGTIYIGDNEFNSLDCSQYDFIQMTPSLCDLKLDCLTNTTNTKLFIGAESVSPDLLFRILKKKIEVVHLYGPTETTVWSTHKHYPCQEFPTSLTVVLGKPFDNEKVYVLDHDHNPLPIGAIGELYIGGIGLARGYVNTPKLTAEKFIPNPFQTEAEKENNKNSRLYRTGDLVRWLPNGNLEYMGRNDFQVKIRGYRVELGEIESILGNYEGIKQSIVIAKERTNKEGTLTGQNYLVGYYLSDTKVNEGKILEYLRSHLPEYMIPQFLISLPSIPLTINGKLDRKSLPEPDFSSGTPYLAPRNTQEALLCNIWSEILGLSAGKIGIQDDFFMLGGDSILAIRLVGKINTEFKSIIKAKDIYESSCISNLTDIINSTKNSIPKDTPYRPFSLLNERDYPNDILDVNTIEDIYPASYLQAKMLDESKADPYGAYHIISNYSVRAKLKKDKLILTMKEIIQRHELLRAAFFLKKEGGYNLAIFKTIHLEYYLYKNENSKELIQREKMNNFDYSKPGLFRLIINDFGNRFDLIFSIHHAIEDGWSMATLINEFEDAYINNKKIEPNLKLSYGEFIRDEINACNQSNINFWKEYLKGLSYKDINSLKENRNSNQETPELMLNNCFFSLSFEQAFLVHKISKVLKISVDNIFLFTYLKTLSSFLKISDIVIGIVANNRLEKEDGDKLFGLFINTIPFRFDSKNYSTDSNKLIEIFNTKVKLQKYKNVPYEHLKLLYKKDLYQFVFNFVNLHIFNKNTNYIESVDGYERTSIPFTLTVAQQGENGFNIGISAQDNFITKTLLEEFTQNFKQNLSKIINSI